MKRIRKRNLRLERLEEVLNRLAADEPLPPQCRPHRLSGDWSGYMECHVAPDWLLIWRITDDGELWLVRTGSHADLFG